MIFDSFIRKYLGKKVDFDGCYEGQCVDLYRQYVEKVLGFPQSVSVKGAVNIWDTAQHKYYSFIKNTLKAIPDKGDIIIWNKKIAKGLGHVAIFLTGNTKSFVSLDQNWPTLNKVTKTKHDYKNVIGWLQPKEMSYKGIDLNNKESIKVCVDSWKDIVDGKYVRKEDYNKKIKQLKEDFVKKETKIRGELIELCNKSLKTKDIQHKKEIKDVLKKAKNDWKVVQLQSQDRAFKKVENTVAYKIAINVQKVLEVLKNIKTGGNKNG